MNRNHIHFAAGEPGENGVISGKSIKPLLLLSWASINPFNSRFDVRYYTETSGQF